MDGGGWGSAPVALADGDFLAYTAITAATKTTEVPAPAATLVAVVPTASHGGTKPHGCPPSDGRLAVAGRPSQRASACRSGRPVFARMLDTCVRTVLMLTPRRTAISAFGAPVRSWPSTRHSAGVSRSGCGGRPRPRLGIHDMLMSLPAGRRELPHPAAFNSVGGRSSTAASSPGEVSAGQVVDRGIAVGSNRVRSRCGDSTVRLLARPLAGRSDGVTDRASVPTAIDRAHWAPPSDGASCPRADSPFRCTGRVERPGTPNIR